MILLIRATRAHGTTATGSIIFQLQTMTIVSVWGIAEVTVVTYSSLCLLDYPRLTIFPLLARINRPFVLKTLFFNTSNLINLDYTPPNISPLNLQPPFPVPFPFPSAIRSRKQIPKSAPAATHQGRMVPQHTANNNSTRDIYPYKT
jgi:hypothetical protein